MSVSGERDEEGKRDNGNGTADLERLIAEITADAHGDNEQLRAFRRALRDGMGGAGVEKMTFGSDRAIGY